MNSSSIKRKKIKIAGAGISGLTAGIILAKNGYSVDIFEKRPGIGSFFEKDIHSIRNYWHDYDVIKKYKEIGIKLSYVYPIFKELRFSPSLKRIEIYSQTKPLFYNFIRGNSKKSFDTELYETAKKNGVNFYFNKTIGIKEADIIATGAPAVKGIAYGEHYKGISSILANANYIFLDKNYAPNGYSYITPFKNEASVVIASTKKESKEKIKKRFTNLKKNNLIVKNIIKGAKLKNEIFGFAFYDLPKTAIRDGKLYVGEAMGFLDAATGFGTHYAIFSGYLAAKSIIKNKNYDNLWKDFFGKELKNQYLKRINLEKISNNDYEKNICNLIKMYGEKISAADYAKIHKN
jgi:flavin-dependent dehydrogenase